MNALKLLRAITPLTLSGLLLVSMFSQADTLWDFNGAPTAGGWKYDLSNRPKQANSRFPIQFVKDKVYTRDGSLFVQSGDLKDSDTVAVQGGGIRKDDVFSTNDTSARCRVVGSVAERKRSMASFWLHPNGPNSHEVDMFEMRPNAVNVTNFIVWKNGKLDKSQGHEVIKWKGMQTSEWATYRLTADPGRTKFTVTRNGTDARTFNTVNNYTIGNEIVLHNKPWRFYPGNLSEGPVGTLECTWVKKKVVDNTCHKKSSSE